MRNSSRSLITLSSFFLLCFAILTVVIAYWTTLNRDSLLARPDNPRVIINFNRIQRGRILDRHNNVLAETIGQAGNYERRYELSTALTVGYASFQYGTSGIEEAMDSTLSGDYDWWQHDVLGEPRIGKNVRLTLDLNLQRQAFDIFSRNKKVGAMVIIAPTGEILALASTPTFDPATLQKDFPSFNADHNAPLLNRATYGLYPTGALIDLFPSTITLTEPLSLLIPTRAGDRNKTTPLQMALLTVAVLNNGTLPDPSLIFNNPSSHSIAIMPRDTAAQLKTKLANGYVITTSSGFGQGTIGWYIGFINGNAICVVLENGTGEEARQVTNNR